MAEKIIIELDLEKGDVTRATKSLADAGDKAGKKAGDNFAKKFNTNISSGLASVAKSALKLTSALGGVATGLLGIQSIRAAQVQEDAINALNSALSISKNAGLDASEGIQAFASELQQVTRFGDEVLIQNAALIQSLGDLDEQGLKRATKATADLATALRVDLNTAAVLVGKAAAGEVGTFSRYGLSIQKGANNAETFAKALTAIESKFGGAAQRDVFTYSGAIDQLSNTFGDLLEEVGNFIIKSPLALKGVKFLNEVFKSGISQVANFTKNFNGITDALIPLSNFGDSIITFVISPLELLNNIFSVAQNGLNLFVAGVVQSFGEIATQASTLLSYFNPDSELAKSLKTFGESSSEVFSEVAMEASSSFNSILDFPFSDKLMMKNEEFRVGMQELNNTIIEESEKTGEQLNTGINTNLNKLNKGLSETTKAANKVINQGLARSISGGIQNIVNSIAKGENALSNFGSFLLSTFGDLSIQLGQFYIAQGLANAALLSVDPSAQIATGAALVALGSILKSFSSKGVGGASGGGVAAVGAQPASGEVSTTLAEPDSLEQASERVNLSLNIEGSLVREKELNGYISDLLEDGASSNANIIPSLRTGIA